MANYLTTDTDLTTVADAIRTKGGTSAALKWPSGYVDAVDAIPTGITPTGTISITSNGTHDVTNYASANVNVSGGGGGGVETAVVSMTATNIYYTDENMTCQHATSSISNIQLPIGTIVAAMPDASSQSGMTKLTGYRTNVGIYKVTG